MIYAENILICIAVPLTITLLFIKGSARRFVTSFLAGMTVCLLAAYISGFLRGVSGMSAEDTSIFLSPIIEEMMKFVPVIFYLMTFLPEKDELLLTATGIGAGFATFENCCYILSSGAESLTYILIRGSAVGVMHLVSMIAIAMGLNIIILYKVFFFSGIVGTLSLAMVFHALYNLLVSEPGISSYIGYALPLVCAGLLYIVYQRFRPVSE